MRRCAAIRTEAKAGGCKTIPGVTAGLSLIRSEPFLKQSKAGLRAVQKRAAKELIEGDVICYDFNGDGRFDHVALVTAKDKSNMPLVNAQTHDCRMRYWSYEDSPAYTSSIRYAFFIYQMIRQNRNEWYNKQRIRKQR